MNRFPVLSALIATTLFSAAVHAQTTLNVYGPGGPAPVMKEAAAAFQKKTGVAVSVTAGPTPTWISKAKDDADVIYSGSETMMSDFVDAMGEQLTPNAPEPLYLRPMAMLVRPGNPTHIRRFTDLLKPGVKILVVNGAGQNGVWEDVAGRLGNSAEAKTTWTDHPEIDVWLIWNIWQVANPSLADVVPIEPAYAIYRDAGVAITRRGADQPASRQFVDFLESKEGAAIFRKWGWKTDP
jgi:accessory colonization factor AcfC